MKRMKGRRQSPISIRRTILNENPLPQDAFRKKPVTDEDKYFAEREAERLQDLQAARAARSATQRHCPCAPCENAVLARIMIDSVEVDKCPKCQGVWLDAGELELLTGRAKGSTNALTRFFRSLAGTEDPT